MVCFFDDHQVDEWAKPENATALENVTNMLQTFEPCVALINDAESNLSVDAFVLATSAIAKTVSAAHFRAVKEAACGNLVEMEMRGFSFISEPH